MGLCRPASIQEAGVPRGKAKCPRQQTYPARLQEQLLDGPPPPSPLPREGRKPPEARAAGTLVCDGSAACQVRLGLRTLHLPWNLETRASASYHHSATWYPLINGAIRPRRPESVYVKDCSTPGQHKMLSPKSSLEVFLIFYSSGRSWYFVIFPSVCNAPKS